MEFENNEFLGRPPGLLSKIGIRVVSAILCVVFLASMLISYRDTIEAEIEVRPLKPPILVKTKRHGQISKISVVSGEFVFRGQQLAKFDNPANYDDLKAIKEAVAKNSLPEELGCKKPTSIGDLQEVYSQYLSAYYQVNLIEQFYDTPINDLLQDTLRLSLGKGFPDAYERLQMAKNTNNLVGKNHSRMKTLFSKGVISQAELEKSKLEYNRSLQTVSELNRDYVTDAYRTNLEFNSKFMNLQIASLKMLSEISLWEERNLLVSPIDGKVSFMDVRSPFQWVGEGEEMFGIVPVGDTPLIGTIKVPISNSGNVRVGQKVIIKLYSFPFEEWGVLQGTIGEISASPKQVNEQYYPAHVLINAAEKNLILGMKERSALLGHCEIILEESTVFKKLFLSFKKEFNRY